MADIIEPRLGIDRCDDPLHTFFALALIEQGKFEWRCPNSHEWEIGQWPGLGLTLLAQPQWGSYRPHFSICPVPTKGHEVPFILLLALGGRIETSCVDAGEDSVTLLYMARDNVRRDVAACAHRAFDHALNLQRIFLRARYGRLNGWTLPNLPCMKSLVELQRPFTAPMSDCQPPLRHTE